MSHILTIVIEPKGEGISVHWFDSEGVTPQIGLAAVQLVERELQRRVVRAELEAERAQAQTEADGDGD